MVSCTWAFALLIIGLLDPSPGPTTERAFFPEQGKISTWRWSFFAEKIHLSPTRASHPALHSSNPSLSVKMNMSAARIGPSQIA